MRGLGGARGAVQRSTHDPGGRDDQRHARVTGTLRRSPRLAPQSKRSPATKAWQLLARRRRTMRATKGTVARLAVLTALAVACNPDNRPVGPAAKVTAHDIADDQLAY